jgi:hypothetical protein
MPVVLNKTAESAKDNSSSRSWLRSPSLMFGIILALSAVFTVRHLKKFNSQEWIGLLEKIDAHSVAPTTRVVSNKTETATLPDVGETTMETAKGDDEKTTNKTTSQSSKPSTTAEEIKNPPVSDNSNAESPRGKEAEGIEKEKGANDEATEFKRYDRVAIVTKIHGQHQWKLLEQSMCLLHHAYNHKVLYDIVIFTALEVPKELIEDFEKMVAPAKVSVVMDNIGFQEEIAALTPAKRELFLERCMVTDPVNLTWWSHCNEPGEKTGGRVAYNWQAEFRSVRIWEDPALEKYKYMLWLDSDGFPSKPWEKDPMGYFIENEGVIMFDNYPQGKTGKFTNQILNSFNETLCDLSLNKEKGHLERNLINHQDYAILQSGNKNNTVICNSKTIHMIHGFFHITDLDFFRQPKVINVLKGLLGDCFLCRTPDDQLAVTLPTAIYAPEKSFDMRSHGFDLKVFHNMHLDGKEKAKPPGFVKYWDQVAKKDFPSAEKACKITQRD